MNHPNPQPDRQRRAVDPLTALAALVIAVTLVGQVWMLTRILRENRPRRMRINASYVRESKPAPMPSAPTTQPPPAPIPSAAAAQPSAPVVAPAPTAPLDRKIRISRVNRTDAVDSVTLTIQARAQTEGRSLDTTAVRIGVQFFSAGPVEIGSPVWLAIPGWDNFSSQQFTAQCSAAPARVVGFVVRSYYRGQLQDVFAVPPDLASREFPRE